MIRSAPLGSKVRIVKTFRDFDGVECTAGTELTLLSRDYFPYDAGHTFTFEGGRVIRLSENVPDDARVLAGGFFELV